MVLVKGQKARNRNDMGMKSSSSSGSSKKRNLNWLFICVSNKCGGILFPICVHTLCTEIRIKMLVEWYEEKKKMECYMVSFIIRSLCNWARVPASMLRVPYFYVFAMICFLFFLILLLFFGYISLDCPLKIIENAR